MRLLARGWSRDHGDKEILEADILESPKDIDESESYSKSNTYLGLKKSVRRLLGGDSRTLITGVRILKHAEVNLCGSYQFEVQISRTEIARLFYMTHIDRPLRSIVEAFTSFGESKGKESGRDSAAA